jgi:hypothetical protein
MKTSYVRDSSGNITHVRETTDDKSTSYLYKSDNSVIGQLFHGGKGGCEEVASHHRDGTTDAYEPDKSIFGSLFNGGRGKHK